MQWLAGYFAARKGAEIGGKGLFSGPNRGPKVTDKLTGAISSYLF
jgi:hypothetical protein